MDEYLPRTTHRNHLAYLAWLDLELEGPDKRDWYDAQTACVVAQANSKNPGRLKVKDFLIRFREPAERPVSAEEATQWARAKWGRKGTKG